MKKDFISISIELQSELIRALFEEKSKGELLDIITACVKENNDGLLNADACSIYIVEKNTYNAGRQAIMKSASGYHKEFVDKVTAPIVDRDKVPDTPEPDEKLGLTGWTISTGRAFLARSTKELFGHPHWTSQSPAKVTTFLAVPLRDLRGRIIGALKAERQEKADPFSIEDQMVLETLARVAGRCLVYFNEIQKTSLMEAVTLWAREVIAEAVSTEGELDSYLDMVVKVISAATRSDACAVFHIDQERRTLTQRAGTGAQALRKVVRSYQLPDEEKVANCIISRYCRPGTCKHQDSIDPSTRVGLTAWIAATGKSFHASNQAELKQHCHHLGHFDDYNYNREHEECGAWIGVPLMVGGVTVGVIKVENVHSKGKPDDRDFQVEDQRLLDLLAQDIAINIERLRFQYKTRYQVILKALPTILEILRGEMVIEKLVQKVVEETAKLFDARACALFLKEGNELIQRAAVGWATKGPPRRYKLIEKEQIKSAPAENEKVGLTVWIAAMREMFTAKSNNELISHPHHLGIFDPHNFTKGERCESFMGMPLEIGGFQSNGGDTQELVGVLKVETKMRQASEEKEFAYFNELDELAFKLMANSTAIAIQNAWLLKSQRLADRILIKPDTNEVVKELYDFLQQDINPVNTIKNTADIVKAKSKNKAMILNSFIKILEPDFNLAILNQFAERLQDPVKELFKGMVLGLQAEKLHHLGKIHSRIEWVTILDEDFFLYDCANYYSELLTGISKKLKKYDDNPERRDSLIDVLAQLNTAKEHVRKMGSFESAILSKICSNMLDIIKLALTVFQEIANPYLAGPPLEPDSPVFVGRDKIFQWIEGQMCLPGQKNSLFIHGGWHTGKSSILKQILAGPKGRRIRKGRGKDVYPVFIDIQRIFDKGEGNFLLRIADSIKRYLSDHNIECPSPDADAFNKTPSRAFDLYLDDVISLIKNGRLLLMLDEFEVLFWRVEESKIDSEIFNYLRSVIQHQAQVSFILAARHSLDTLDTNNITKLYNVTQHRDIGVLSPEETTRLIRDSVRLSAVAYSDEVVDSIQRLTGGHPYFIQQLCHACIDYLNEVKDGYDVHQKHLDYAVDKALSPGDVATLDELWKEVGSNCQQVLKVLAIHSKKSKYGLSIHQLEKKMESHGNPTTDISSALNKLMAYRLISSEPVDSGMENQYRHSVDLMRKWVLRRP